MLGDFVGGGLPDAFVGEHVVQGVVEVVDTAWVAGEGRVQGDAHLGGVVFAFFVHHVELVLEALGPVVGGAAEAVEGAVVQVQVVGHGYESA